MGGRKKTGKKEKKLRTYAIPKVFDCENCSADQTLNITISKKSNKKEAKIYCVKCKYVTKIDEVGDSAIDVYNKWCDGMHKKSSKQADDFIDDVDGENDDIGEDIDIGDEEF